MNKKEFGRLISSLRRERLDHYFKPWTRDYFLAQCHNQEGGSILTEAILTAIENGRKQFISPEELTLLAKTLKLTNSERREFFLAASGIDETEIFCYVKSEKEAVEHLLDNLKTIQSPAFIVDQYWDIIAINRSLSHCYQLSEEQFFAPSSAGVARFNMMRVLFAEEFAQQRSAIEDWEAFATGAAMLFRASTLRYRATEYFQALYGELCQFEGFKYYLNHPKVGYGDFLQNMAIRWNHPRFGKIETLTTSSSIATYSGQLTLSIFNPLTAETLNVFANYHSNEDIITIFGNWPQKGFPDSRNAHLT